MPLGIDLFCGLGGWTEGLLATGWDVVGFDIERHRYNERECPDCSGTGNFYRNDCDGDFLPCDTCYRDCFEFGKICDKYPAQLVLQDILTIHGSQFSRVDLIVASPPCQEFSYMAMPWKRGKQIQEALRSKQQFPEGYTGSLTIQQLTALFDACFRIQREACVAAGRYIPMVVENVKGAQPWVGRAKWHYGSFYLWGDVPALMPVTARAKVPGISWSGFGKPGYVAQGFNTVADQHLRRETKNGGNGSWFNVAHNTDSGKGNNPDGRGVKVPSESGRRTDVGKGARFTSRDCGLEGIKQAGLSGEAWFNHGAAAMSSKSSARKAASAAIAKIPFDLSRYIGEFYYPR